MKNNLLHLWKFVPKWKIGMYFLLSFFLTSVTVMILLPALWYLEDNSRFIENLLFILSYFRSVFVFFFYGVTMCLYLLLFYQYERKRYFAFYIRKMTEDVQKLVRGEQTSGVISGKHEFEKLAEGIQTIIAKSEQAILNVKKAEQLKNELVTNVAHDLRSPLTSIIGYLDLINKDRYRDEVELRYYIQVIHAKTDSLHTLINDIFEYTHMQNEQAIIQQHSIHIEEMLNQLAVQTQIQLEEAGMEWRQFNSATDPVIVGNGEKLVRVFENLIQNAIRYGSDGKFLDIRLDDNEKIVKIEIINYGQHIPSVDLPHIFERFYRVEKSRSQFTGGSGLGLAIAKSIIDLHGGTIEVTSVPGRTAFTIKLLKK
ncbi:sensor histidine kinase [Metabacillus fastidiosus]|uniref:sensor histidine kinase n=1 Tax=Metabacillus fastidiosus TaxID=1458 RepID=UPI003D2E8EF5